MLGRLNCFATSRWCRQVQYRGRCSVSSLSGKDEPYLLSGAAALLLEGLVPNRMSSRPTNLCSDHFCNILQRHANSRTDIDRALDVAIEQGLRTPPQHLRHADNPVSNCRSRTTLHRHAEASLLPKKPDVLDAHAARKAKKFFPMHWTHLTVWTRMPTSFAWHACRHHTKLREPKECLPRNNDQTARHIRRRSLP